MTTMIPRPLDWGMPMGDGFVPLTAEWIEQPVIAAFLQAAAQNADRLAISDGLRRWSYSQLAGHVARFSAQLAMACPPGTPIALALTNDARAPAVMLAALAVGLPYVPVDLSFPHDRNTEILRHSGVSAVVTTADRRAAVMELAHGRPILVLDEDETAAVSCVVSATPDHVAYVLYTSGSSGRPKGVFQNQRNLLHDILQYVNSVHLTAADSTTLLYSPSVNGAIRDIFGALLTGAALHVIDLRVAGLAGIVDILHREAITLYHSMPPILRAFLGGLPAETRFGSIRLIYLAGDRLFRSDVELCRRHFAATTQLYIGLGSTENATIFRQWTMDATHRLLEDLVPVGYAVPDRSSTLLGDDGLPVAPGEIGEIVVRSRHMALGYWNEPELTAAAFRPCPHDPLARQFHTGDLGREDVNGLLHFIGRKDRQVKIRGYRVEPAEVEAVLRNCPSVADSAVMARELGRHAELIAFVVRTGKDGTDPGRWLADRLPPHMRPVVIIPVDTIPTLPNLKTDQAALIALDDARRAALSAIDDDNGPSDGNIAQGFRSDVYQAVWSAWTQRVGAAAFRANASWEEAGGDSLKAMELILAIESQLGQRIAAEIFTMNIRPNDFMALLLQRFEASPQLEETQFRAMVASHAGELPLSFPEDGFDGFHIAAANASGARPPLFWCMQHQDEHRALAAALGPDHPVYGMRSGYPLPKSYPLQRLLGRRYARAIMAITDGPYLVGGNCQGAHVAFEIAHALRESGKDVSLLFLMEAVILRPYPGQVAILFGEESTTHNPFLRGMDPRSDWDRLYSGHSVEFIPGRHGQYFFDANNLSALVAKLRGHLVRAASATAILPRLDSAEPTAAATRGPSESFIRNELEAVKEELRRDAGLLLTSRSWKLTRAMKNALNRVRGRAQEHIPTADMDWRHSLSHIRNIRHSLAWDLTAPLRLPAKLSRIRRPRPAAPAPMAPQPRSSCVAFHGVVDTAHAKSSLAYAFVASWHAQCRDWSVLRLTLVGENPRLERFAASLGVQIVHRSPHPLAQTLPFANKWLAAEAEHPGERAILVDSDTIFLSDPWLLRSLPTHYFAARPAPALRMSQPLQDWMMKTFNLPGGLNLANWGLAAPYMAGSPLSDITAASFIRRFRYYNGGVVAFPAGQFKATLESWSRSYTALLDHASAATVLAGEQEVAAVIRGSDQLALCLTLANQPVFQLDCSHNFVASDLVTGLSEEEIAIMHFPGALPGLDTADPGAVIQAFTHIMDRHRQHSDHIFQRFPRFDTDHLRQKICDLVDRYALRDLAP